LFLAYHAAEFAAGGGDYMKGSSPAMRPLPRLRRQPSTLAGEVQKSGSSLCAPSPSSPENAEFDTKAPSIALIVLTYQGTLFLDRLLPSLSAQTYPYYRIVVVDNGSTDGTIEQVNRRLGAQAQIISNPTNLGCATGYNIGAAACADEDVLCFLNQDIVLDPDYCRAIATRLEADPEAVALQPLVRCLDNPNLVENCGHTADIWLTTRTIGHLMAPNTFDVPTGLLFTLTAPAVRRKWFEALRGFDESLFVYYEDTDLSLRIWEAGGRVVFEPHALVEHQQEGSSSAFPDEWRAFLWSRNRVQLLWKHASRPSDYARALLVTGAVLTALPLLAVLRPRIGIAVARGLGTALVRLLKIQRDKGKAPTRQTFTALRDAGVLRPSDGVLTALRRAFMP
jgi:GT2 family glycosyltransferase